MRRLPRPWAALALCGLALLTTLPAGALAATAPLDDATVEARLRKVATELRCLVCQNQTIADSQSGLAQDLRDEARALIRRGASDDEVRHYMTERYGDFVLYRPPVKPTTWLLWAAPALLAAAGAVLLALTLRRRARLPADAFEPDPELPEASP
ncbi:cytochrome c-type biogenesis protein [Rubrivivax albus]|uniref:Cytochrome c-type biogenesis protein n=1 Tax=Rubrivivax albus TaxID=2499835 RepID=A0A437JQ78_9BURK|nr:cytochrome c-type biogenesis protein [Rubrivivax albus]RVT48960.1 cytochrome c-type biogenesis protein CcmH [Rubrivivax albus]